jgi:DNA adenine methylase
MPTSQPNLIETTSLATTKPLLRWAGGKRRLLAQILPVIPKTFNNYFEPFCGGAALFFKLAPKSAILSDKNSELIDCYIAVRDEPEEVIKKLKKFHNSESDYYRIRKQKPESRIDRAARLIYLTALSFNGLHRVNSNGEFNVPYGQNSNRNPRANTIVHG